MWKKIHFTTCSFYCIKNSIEFLFVQENSTAPPPPHQTIRPHQVQVQQASAEHSVWYAFQYYTKKFMSYSMLNIFLVVAACISALYTYIVCVFGAQKSFQQTHTYSAHCMCCIIRVWFWMCKSLFAIDRPPARPPPHCIFNEYNMNEWHFQFLYARHRRRRVCCGALQAILAYIVYIYKRCV